MAAARDRGYYVWLLLCDGGCARQVGYIAAPTNGNSNAVISAPSVDDEAVKLKQLAPEVLLRKVRRARREQRDDRAEHACSRGSGAGAGTARAHSARRSAPVAVRAVPRCDEAILVHISRATG